MKTYKSNTLSLKKLTVARINSDALQLLKGGSSYPPTTSPDDLGTIRRRGGMCHLQAR
ncbi:class I lanthipeptide [Aquimarina aggregata]|uniref:class I lanthipeptide n=1 Tax=Aquimarina aggregata TaxID=1642818 RepID=UPI000A5FAA3C|nr:class I lanthipeptide [Aquimarina aggregata]